ncbi:MAG TPA: hypothetical protein VJ867_05825 [Gemmatimonadaceae bacterium]|nr:hypothetical protein [Gemmatimonadaceae bacterium]
MMMARDSSPQRPQLDAASLNALSAALLRYLDDGEDGAPLQTALRAVATEARSKQIHAEQLLLILKEAWYALPAMRQREGDEQNRMLQRVVTLCIRQYYSV